jgi:hypothetical protein
MAWQISLEYSAIDLGPENMEEVGNFPVIFFHHIRMNVQTPPSY